LQIALNGYKISNLFRIWIKKGISVLYTPDLMKNSEPVRKDKNMDNEQKRNLAVFYCRNVPESNENARRDLEKEYGPSIKFFPVVCSGRMDMIHLLKALEDFADAAYIITCPEGACRYFEGNLRAKKRVEKAKSLIESIGLERERIDIIIGSAKDTKPLSAQVEELVKRASKLSSSPVHNK
jgi:F420-non-reducing hydrogenase iron-sulfur subunit